MLRERNLLGPEVEPAYSITLITPHILNISAFTSADNYYHVRVKEIGILPHEYENHCSARQAFPRYVPEPLGRRVSGEWDIFVVRGVPHRSVPAGSIAGGRGTLIPELVGFIDASSKGAKVARAPEPHTAALRRIHERTVDPVCAEIVTEWMASEQLDKLPHILQHGDFVVNNLGLADSRLVVFDWEDFGRIVLPGFDLCTVLASDAAFDRDALRAIITPARNGPDPYAELLDGACPAIGLTPEMFRKLIPLYLVIFLALKSDHQNYGGAIRQLVRTAIHGVRGGSEI
jgi:hypothetical protein